MARKEVLERALKTFIEGFIASLVANVYILENAVTREGGLKTAAYSLLIGAIAAGMSAAWNGVFEKLFKKEV